MKCDSCTNLYVDPPCQDDPYGTYACGKGHWDGTDGQEVRDKDDPWKFCKDYEANAPTDDKRRGG